MSQYTSSIKAMVELEALKEGIKPYELRIDDYISRGRKLIFNFTYAGDTVFKEYFEKRFITKYLLENINNEYPPLWLQYVETIVQISAPLYYLKYQGLNQLTIDKMLSDGIRLTEINKDGTADSDMTGKTTVNDATTHNNRATSTDAGTNKKTGTVTSVYEDDSTDRTTTEATGSGSGSSTNTNSAFPFNVAPTTSVNAINYKTDGGKVESSNTATDSSSSQTIHADDSTKTDTYNTTDTISDSRSDTFTGADEHNGITNRNDTKADSFKEHELINEKLTGNLLDKVMKLYSVDFNPVESFVDELYSKLFILLW